MKKTTMFTALTAGVATAALAAGPAGAHTFEAAHGGFQYGFLHPFGGLDHVLVMVAVGLWAAHLGGRARWMVPGSFLAVTGLAGTAAMAGLSVPFTETGIALSVFVAGALVWARVRLPVAIGMALVGGFALFHGAAHGLAAPAADATYGLGFLAATALLHGAGLGLGRVLSDGSGGLSPATARAAGGAMVAAGLVFLAV